ncbi:hypothetical protein C8R43DRAFT_882412, partial [Mycena crocata]
MTNPPTIGAWVEEFNGKPPVLHAGDMTPLLLNDFSSAANTYFDYKKIPAAERVSSVIGNIREQEFKNWIRDMPTRARLNAMTFEDFMSAVATKFLSATWEIETRYTISQLRHKVDDKFSKYATEVTSYHTLLIGTKSQLDPARLRHTMEAGMCQELKDEYANDEPAKDVDLDKIDAWRTEVDRVDRKRLIDHHKAKRMAEALLRAEALKRKAENDGERTSKKPASSTSSKPPSTSSTASSRPARNCPKLTDDEKKLLDENDGCRKCRRFFCGHLGHNCPNDWPDAASYETLTQ